MKGKLLAAIASQLYLVLFMGLSVRNIHRHPQDATVINISIFTIIFFTAIISMSLTATIGKYLRNRNISMPAAPPADPRKERRTELIIIVMTLIAGAAVLLFVK